MNSADIIVDINIAIQYDIELTSLRPFSDNVLLFFLLDANRVFVRLKIPFFNGMDSIHTEHENINNNSIISIRRLPPIIIVCVSFLLLSPLL